MSAQSRVCVIGAGASGITVAKSLAQRGIPFDCFDKGDRVGGLWVYENVSGLSSAYEELNINVSRERLEFTDYPMPKSYPLFPSHSQVVRYFEDYVERFGVNPHLHLRTGVQSVRRTPDMRWEVQLDTGKRLTYDVLVIANGHHSKPLLPHVAGDFHGEQMHSHSYRHREVLRDKDVLVVGFGNSGCDIAVEASYVARSTQLSIRHAVHVIPLTVFGWPYDQIPGSKYLLGKGIRLGALSAQLPWLLRQFVFTAAHRAGYPMNIYGLPTPKHLFGAVHPTQAPHLLDRLLHGRIEIKPEVERLADQHVHFTDGTRVKADLIVWCTGYEVDFQFLAPELVPVRDNRVELYWNMFRPGVPNIAFVGLVQASAGASMPIAEAQGNWLAGYVAGEYALPSEQAMWSDIEKRRRLSDCRRASTPRHTMEIDQFDYLWRLKRELQKGRERTRQRRFTVTVSADSGSEQRELPWWKRLQERSITTRFGTWFAIVIATRVDRVLLRWTKGRLAMFAPWPVGLLETVGARSGKPRTIPLLCLVEANRIVLVASKGGDSQNPAWYYNVRANPDVYFTIHGRRSAYRAHESEGEERIDLWRRVNDLYHGYEKYQDLAGERLIPVIVLEPAASDASPTDSPSPWISETPR